MAELIIVLTIKYQLSLTIYILDLILRKGVLVNLFYFDIFKIALLFVFIFDNFVLVLACMMACIASDTASMASMASSDRSTTPDQFGSNEYDPLLLPLGMFDVEKVFLLIQFSQRYSLSLKKNIHYGLELIFI